MNYGENEISSNLIKLGHKVVILTGDRYFPFPNYDQTVGNVLGPRVQKVGKQKSGKLIVQREKVYFEFAARSLFFGIREAIAEYKPDILLVSGTSTPAAVQASLFKPKNARLILVDSHLPSELSQGEQLPKKIFYFLFRLLFSGVISKKADKVIAVQEDTAKIIRDEYGIKKPAVIISHGTDKELFSFSREARAKIRKELGIPARAFVIITTGKIIPAKGVDLLFKAFDKLHKNHSEIYLLVVGDGPEEYKKVCYDSVIKSNHSSIFLVGFKPQRVLPQYYSAADVAVWPLQESLAMNDAISCSLPVIANDKIGVKERFSRNNAVLYKQGSVGDLVKKIEMLYKDPARRKKMGKNGRELVVEKMSWLQKAREYID